MVLKMWAFGPRDFFSSLMHTVDLVSVCLGVGLHILEVLGVKGGVADASMCYSRTAGYRPAVLPSPAVLL